MKNYDVLVLGAGAAGLMAAIEAAKRGRRVLVVDHAKAAGEKIRISGGGRCNFTNINTRPDRFYSANPRFAVSALTRYTPQNFIDLVRRYGIAFHEKALGQLFCDGASTQIVSMLLTELHRSGGRIELETTVDSVEKASTGFTVRLSSGPVAATSLIVATGGKSIPKMGATGFAYKLAEQFGLAVTETRPALVPLTFEPRIMERFAPLSGVSLDVAASSGKKSFTEAMLFTHRGLSGPAILQISSVWREGEAISLDLGPGLDFKAILTTARAEQPKLALQTILGHHLPKRFAQLLGEELNQPGPVGDLSDKRIAAIDDALRHWLVTPTSSEGYRTAEVTLGGIDTAGLSSTTMEARTVPGLYFIGECVDVTGWLGGYNFQWAWASGWAAGQVA